MTEIDYDSQLSNKSLTSPKRRILTKVSFLCHNFNEMKVKVLGNQAPFQLNGKKGVGYLVKTQDGNFMLDAGSGSHSNLSVNDYENLKLVLSHGHYDHVADIENLLYAALTLKSKGIVVPNLSIYLPENYKDNLEKKALVGDIKPTDVAEIIRYGAGDRLKIGGTRVDFLKTTHSPDSSAIKVSAGGASLGYTGDISTDDLMPCAEFFGNADAIISECSLPQNYPKQLKHLRPHDCANLKNQSNAKSIYLTHFFPTENPKKYLKHCKEKTDNAYIATENLTFNL